MARTVIAYLLTDDAMAAGHAGHIHTELNSNGGRGWLWQPIVLSS